MFHDDFNSYYAFHIQCLPFTVYIFNSASCSSVVLLSFLTWHVNITEELSLNCIGYSYVSLKTNIFKRYTALFGSSGNIKKSFVCNVIHRIEMCDYFDFLK
jgi:hypothetical protein